MEKEETYSLSKVITGLIFGFGLVHVIQNLIIPYWWILFYHG